MQREATTTTSIVPCDLSRFCLRSYRRFNHFDELSGRFWLRSWAGSADSLDNPAFTRSDELLHLRALDRPCCYHDDTLSLASTCPSHGTRINTIYPHRYIQHTHKHTHTRTHACTYTHYTHTVHCLIVSCVFQNVGQFSVKSFSVLTNATPKA